MKKHLRILSLATMLLLNGCDDAPTSTPTPMPTHRTYRVFTEQSYPPFIMHGGHQVSGFEYDLLDAIAKNQGFELHYTAHLWAGLFDALQEDRADILSAGITITETRKAKMLFSNPYFETETVLLVSKDAPIKTFNDLMGKKVAVKKGTSQDQIVHQYQKGHGQAIYVGTTWLAIREIIKNNADAALGDWGVMRYYVKKHGDEYGIHVVRHTNAEKEQLGFAIQKNNVELQKKINDGLAQLKKDGTYQQIYQKWFGE